MLSRLPAATLLLALALTAMAGPVAAEEGALQVGSLVYDGDATETGGLAMLFVFDDVGEASTPWVAGSAASVRAVQHTRTWTEAPLPVAPPRDLPVPESLKSPAETQPVQDDTFTTASLRLTAHQAGFELHAFSLEGAIEYSASSDERTLEQRPSMAMGPQVMGEPRTDVATGEGIDHFDFATVDRSGPFVLHAGAPSHTSITLRGDLVVEMRGLTLALDAAEGHRDLASGTFQDGTVDGSSAAYDVRDVFIRLFLEDAELTIAVDGGSPRVDWASGAVTMEPTESVMLYNSYGHIGDQELNGARYLLPTGNLLTIQPTMDGLAVQVTEPELGTRGTIADVPAPASAALVGTGAVLALLVAIGIGLLRRVLRMPQLAEVERAIEEGEYRRAARMAGRILARRPADESAVLARAIALSKAGDQRRTVAELSAHLAQASATDGSLHYVLGLAQLDLGQKDDARASLREAVRLTPSLSAEVGSRLGKAFSSPVPMTKETSGYA